MTVQENANLRDTLTQVVQAWNEAGREWTTDSLVEIYSLDACMFGGRPTHSVGSEEIRRYFGSYEGNILRCQIELLDQNVTAPIDHLMIAQGHVKLSFLLEGNVESESVLRSTLVLRRTGEEWRISHHHFSKIPDVPPLGIG